MRVATKEFGIRPLLLLALLAVSLPPALLAVFVVTKLAAAQQTTLEESVRQRVDAISVASDRYFDSIVALLRAISTSSSLQRGDLQTFERTVRALITSDALAGGLALLTPDGRLELEAPDDRPAVDREAATTELVAQVVRTGKPAVADLYPATAPGGVETAVASPVFRNGVVAHVIMALIPAASLDAFLRAQHLPPTWIGALVDRKGIIAARTRDPSRFVGRRATPQFLERATGESGGFTSVNLEGLEVYGVYRRSPETGWISAIGLLRGSVVAPAVQSVTWLIGGGLLAGAIAVTIGVWATRRILAPVRILTRAAQAIGEGEVPVVQPTGVQELTAIGRELVAASERRLQAEAAQWRTAEKLQQRQRMETVGQLAAGVAHDFNNLLMVLNGNLELLQRQPLPARAARHVTAAMGAVDRGDKLVSQILTFGQRQMLNPTPCDVEAQLSALHGLLQTALGPEIPLELAFQARGAVCVIDTTEFDRAVLNIAINARDAMGGAGRFRIATTLLPHGDGRQDEMLRIGFSDTGGGMPPEVLERAFEPFFTTKGIGQGSGLGLSQVYGFAQQSGGQVTLDSRAATGTTVLLDLPLAPADCAPPTRG